MSHSSSTHALSLTSHTQRAVFVDVTQGEDFWTQLDAYLEGLRKNARGNSGDLAGCVLPSSHTRAHCLPCLCLRSLKIVIEEDFESHGSLEDTSADNLPINSFSEPWVDEVNNIMRGREKSFETQSDA